MSGTRSAIALLAAARGTKAEEYAGAIVVDGGSKLVPLLVRELRAGGNPAVVREGKSPAGAVVYLWVGEADEGRLREAALAQVPVVAVTDAEELPYVLATDLVRVPAGQGFPLKEIGAALARKLGDRGAAYAAELPVLRDAVVDELIRSAARRNGVLAAGLFVPGVDMPVLTIAQIRLVSRIGQAYGERVERERAAELAGVAAAGLGFRTLAREALDLVPVAGWVVKGGIAFAGTKAVGEAARRYFAERAVRPGS